MWIGTGLAPRLTGIERLLVDCVNECAVTCPAEQTVLVHEADEWASLLPSSAKVIEIPRRRLAIARRSPLPGWVKPPALVHSFGSPPPKLRGAITSYTVHDWGPLRDRSIPPTARSAWTAAMLRGVRAASQLHFYSGSVRDDAPAVFRPLIARRRVLLGLPSGPRLAKSPARPSRRDADSVLSVGSDVPRKRFGLLAEAVEYSGTLALTLVGDGTASRSNRYVRGLGRVTDDELSQQYSRTRVFALVSEYEGFGLPVLEAWLAGCRIVISSEVASRLPYEIVQDAHILPSGAGPEQLAALLRAAADQPTEMLAVEYAGIGVLTEQVRQLSIH